MESTPQKHILPNGETLYSIPESTILVSIFNGLIGYVFDDRELFSDLLKTRLSIPLPKKILNEADMHKALYIYFIASYAQIEDIEFEAVRLLIEKGYKPNDLADMSVFSKDDEGLREITPLLMQCLINLEVDVQKEFAEIDGLMTQIQMGR
jgi:hypothetical protein